MTLVERDCAVTGGIDTHRDVHVAAALDPIGGLLGVESFDVSAPGYRALLGWMGSFGPLRKVGVEGTGAYGAGLARYRQKMGIEVIEVDRTNRQARGQKGKSDPVDAVEAARAALSGRAQGTPTTRDGRVEAIRALVVAKRSARQARIVALGQMRQVSLTAPDALRERLKGLSPRRCGLSAPRCAPARPPTWWAMPPRSRSVSWDDASRGSRRRSPASTCGWASSWLPPRRAARPVRGGGRHRGHVARERRRQPRAASLRGGLRPSLRGGAHRGVLGEDRPLPAQPRWRPSCQPGVVAHRHGPPRLRPEIAHLHRTALQGRTLEARGDPHPEALRGPGGLPRAHSALDFRGRAWPG
jgi:hypothetical protein